MRPGQVDIRVEIARRERARRREDRLPSVQPRIARPRDGTPERVGSISTLRSSGPFLIHENHMVELVDRLEADDERRIPMLLEHRRREERRLEAMRGVMPHDAAKTAQRGAARRRLGVVGKRVQIALNRERRAQPRDQPSLGGVNLLCLPLPSCGHQRRRSSSATSSAGVQSAPE